MCDEASTRQRLEAPLSRFELIAAGVQCWAEGMNMFKKVPARILNDVQ